MRTLDRYLLRNFFFNYVVSLFVMISLYVVLDLFVNFDEFTEDRKPVVQIIIDIADYYVFNVPMYFAQLSGIITLFAACFTLARIQKANEMTAVLASGTSLYRLAAPIVVAGFVMNVLLVANYELLLPSVAPKLARARDDVEGARVYDLWFVKDGNNRLISTQVFRPSEGRIRGLIVVELSTRPETLNRLAGAITADKAEWDAAAGGWQLINGRHYDLSTDTIANVTPTRIDFYSSDLSPNDLVLRKMTAWTQFLSTRQLNQLVGRGVKPEQIAPIKHTRFTMPINNMILLLLGISFFLNRLPESVLTEGAKALATCSAVFLIAFVGQRLVGSAGLQISGMNLHSLPAWVPIFLFGPLAVVLLDNIKT